MSTHQLDQAVFRPTLPEDIDFEPFPSFPPLCVGQDPTRIVALRGRRTGILVGGGFAGCRFWRFFDGGPATELVLEHAQAAPAAVAGVGMRITALRAVPRRARGLGTSGIALADQVVAILADSGRLAAGLPEPPAGGAAAA